MLYLYTRSGERCFISDLLQITAVEKSLKYDIVLKVIVQYTRKLIIIDASV